MLVPKSIQGKASFIILRKKDRQICPSVHSLASLGESCVTHSILHILFKIITYMAEPSKFGVTRNSGYFSFLSISHSGEVRGLLFSAELKTTCLHLNMVYKMYLSCNFE